ncbi:trimethylamine methyltransferase [Candidatus Aerophobetes bacterium]|uniref:Methyltransferase n=1 Tax=Aerophobetes bacterium TaxID=2030807 RepID=A0A497E644_UNCAE|nr:MAG: trimethylamine methyltransferase [Candidatus Aerophobetes bacterium]RLE12376.1 MAG: trimethylamine methyltransferase [Candidatus Aerophobetes bacterium]
MERKSLVGGKYKVLSDKEVEMIHNASLRTLEKTGMEVNSKKALEIFKEKGAKIDFDKRRVKIPRSMVEDAIDKAPSKVVLCGREEKHNLILEDKRVYMGTAGTALSVLDLDTGEKRPSTLKDVGEIARLVDALENIQFYHLTVYPNDLPREKVDVNRYYAALSNTTKHIMGGPYTREGALEVIKIAEEIAGGEEALREKPIISFTICAMSPLKIDATYGEILIDIVKKGIPVAVPTEPQCGTTAPVTLAGNLVLYGAETLAGVTLAQLVNPGTPVICGYVGTIADVRTMAYTSGAVEMGLLNAGAAQLAQYWRLPFYGTGGMTDSKIPDIQSGYERALNLLPVALAGANYIHDAAGYLESALTVAYEQYVIDNEIIGMVMRALRGIEVNEDTLALDVIDKVGPGGNFLTEEHTVSYMRSEFFFPKVSDRSHREKWLAEGGKDAKERAKEMAKDILAKHKPLAIPLEVRKRIEKRKDIVYSLNF